MTPPAVVPPPNAERWYRVGLVTVVGVAVVVRNYYMRLWLGPFSGPGEQIEQYVDGVVGGTAAAPFQYRPLAPWLIDGLRELGATTYGASLLLDTTALAVGCALGVLLFVRAGVGWLVAVGAGWFAFLGISAGFLPKPETFLSLAVLTVAFLLIDRTPTTATWCGLGAVAAALALVRIDLLGAVASAFAVRWLLDRQRRDLVAASALVVVAVGGQLVLQRAWPDARYSDFGTVQLRYNLDIEILAAAAATLLLPFTPFLVGEPRAMLAHPLTRRALPLLAPALAEASVVAVVGRLDELRLFLPFAWGTALGAVLLGLAAIAGTESAEPEVAA